MLERTRWPSETMLVPAEPEVSTFGTLTYYVFHYRNTVEKVIDSSGFLTTMLFLSRWCSISN